MDPDAPFLSIVAGSTLVDAAVAGAALFLHREPPGAGERPVIGLGRVAWAAAVTAAVFLIKLAFLTQQGVGFFGWVHLVYADLVVLIPAACLAVLASSRPDRDGRPWRRLTPPVRRLAWAGLGLALVGVYATLIEPFRLRLESARVRVSSRREGTGVVRVGVLTDLQTTRVTDYERSAIDRLMAQRPDVVLIPGDVFQGNQEQFEATREPLRQLFERLIAAPGGVYLVFGDTEGPGDHLRDLLRSMPVRILVNEAERVQVGDRRLTIGGVELNYDSGPARRLVDRLESDPDEGDVRILLAHRPDVALGLRPRSRVDLVVAGHTHGGQIVVPGFGPPMTLSNVPRAVAAGGLHAIAGNAIYVSRGVGCERNQAPRIRFLCPPEISLLEVGARD